MKSLEYGTIHFDNKIDIQDKKLENQTPDEIVDNHTDEKIGKKVDNYKESQQRSSYGLLKS